MRQLLGEYGRLLAAVAIAAVFALILLSPEGILKLLGGFAADSNRKEEGETQKVLQKLSEKGNPTLKIENKILEIGDSVYLKDMVREASHGEHEDLRDQVRYFLEDGTEVDGSYEITGARPGVLKIRFSLTGDHYLVTQEAGFIQIQSRTLDPQITALVEEWDIGCTEGEVTASLYRKKDETLLLALQGRGKIKEMDQTTVPWKDYREEIQVCRLDPALETEKMDGWFYQCRELREIPEFPSAAVSFRYTFQGCEKLISAGIPPEAIDIEGMYADCGNLEITGPIPSKVVNCRNAFKNCRSLRGSLVLEGCPSVYEGCLLKAASRTGELYLQLVADSEEKRRIAEAMEEEAAKDDSSCHIFVRKI